MLIFSELITKNENPTPNHIIYYNMKIKIILKKPFKLNDVKALDIESGDTIEWILNTETETLELKVIK